MLKRRDALKRIGGLAGLAGLSKFLPACGDDGGGEDGPGAITNYVLLMLENRSYDHVLGARALEGLGGDGLRADMMNPDMAGNPVAPFAAVNTALCDPDPPHSWDAAHLQFNAGAMDGFVTEHQKRHAGGIEPMKYLTREQQPVTWALADHYTTCDRWFSAIMGPTWPNRFYWHTGTSNGINNNSIDTEIVWPTIWHRLNEAAIEWRQYYTNVTLVGLVPTELLDRTDRLHDFGRFINDAVEGTLPPVSFIEPGYYLNDDHPPVHPINAQQLIATIYSALAMSPQWKNTLFIVTYDEGGGYFDHVPPPTTADDHAAMGFDQLGSRVPALVIGPYVKPGFVSSTVYNHASALKTLEVAFNLAPLTARTTAAADLTDCIDMDRLAAGEWLPPVEIPTVTLSDWAMPDECFGEGFKYRPPAPGECPMHDWANAKPDLVRSTDRRGSEDQVLEQIRRFLRESRPALIAATKR